MNQTVNPTPSRFPKLDFPEGAILWLLLFLILAGNLWNFYSPSGQEITLRSSLPDDISLSEDSSLPPAPQGPMIQPRDLNHITREQLELLPGIGPALATEILHYRSDIGSFQNLDQLLEVPGIGPAKYQILHRYLFVEGEVRNSTASVHIPPATSSDTSLQVIPQKPGKKKIDLNHASLQELQTIPGIGEKFAQKIIEIRNNQNGFHNWDELDAIPGIGTQRLENLKSHAYIHTP